MSNLLSVSDAAAELGVTSASLYNAIRQKRLRAQRNRRGQLFIRRADLDAYNERRTKRVTTLGLAPATREVEVPGGEFPSSIFIKKPASAYWRRHAELPAGGVHVVEVPVGYAVAVAEKRSAVVPDVPGAVRVVSGG